MRKNRADTEVSADQRLTTLLQASRQGHLSDAARAAVDDLVTAFEKEEVRASLAGADSRFGRLRRPWLIAIPAILLAIALPTAAVAINAWSAHTGVFGGSGTEVPDRSEWLGLDAEDAPEAVVELYTELPLPQGATADDVIRPVAAMLEKMGDVPEGEAGHVLIQESAVRGLFERAARCLWLREWLDADTHQDDARRVAAVLGIQDAVNWPATTASDGGGVRELLQSQADAAAAGKRNAVLGAYGKCSNFYGSVQR